MSRYRIIKKTVEESTDVVALFEDRDPVTYTRVKYEVQEDQGADMPASFRYLSRASFASREEAEAWIRKIEDC